MTTITDAKQRLDYIMNRSRSLWYKPIQIAEVLYRSRVKGSVDVANKHTYSAASKHWRDAITKRLIGRSSTSSSRFQDDVWNENAMPPTLLTLLDAENKATQGAVERYIYMRFEESLSAVGRMMMYLENATPETFDLEKFLNGFEGDFRLRRSMDKVYEVVVYALFSTLVAHLEAQVTLHVNPAKRELLQEFREFAEMLLGVSPENLRITQAARLYRVGVTNAADTGLDIWANFGPAVQVKHITLSAEVAAGATNEVQADRLVIVCKRAEVAVIHRVLDQIGFGQKVRGIVTEYDLIEWYKKCLFGQYADELAMDLLQGLLKEMLAEFPQMEPFAEFFAERAYDKLTPSDRWQLATL
jgi:type II restriction enzyme